ncbi:hypothetical protein ACT3RL_11210, partial [Halomonas sp. AOP5-CZ2-32]
MEKKKIINYFYSNAASVFWSTILIVGGGIFVIYYALIGYMPDFDLKSSVAIIAAASVTSIMAILVMLIMMVLAGSFWGGVWNTLGEKSELKKYWIENSLGKNFFNLIVWFAVPLFSVYLSLFINVFIEGWYWVVTLFFTALGFLVYLCLCSGFGFLRGGKEFVFLMVATVISSSFIFTPLYFVFKLSIEEFDKISYLSLFYGLLATIFIVFINMISATPQGNAKPYVKEFLLGAMALLMILMIFGKFDRIPYNVMKIYKFGNIQASGLVLSKNGCELYESLGLETSSTDYDICIAKDVLIL